ncbi:MAG: MATE family efflux transporter [Sphaerochaetaceae bacterium]|nr:MATE family efflux transporter [Sphaerochaetaceae bacterium]
MGKTSKDIYELEKLPIYKMLLQIASPVIFSLIIQALYTLVDGIYVSWIDEAAISAVSLAFVIQNVEIALFGGVASGINAIISKALGAGDKKEARNATLNGCIIQVLFSVVFAVFGLFGVKSYFSSSTSDLLVIQYGVSYLTPCMLASVVVGLQTTFERFLNSVGMTKQVLISHVVGSVINIILDPILMFGYLGLPALGVAGAAYATIFSQLCSLCLNIYFNLSQNKTLFDGTRSEVSVSQMGRICAIGLPTSGIGILTSVGNYAINKIVLGFSTTALAAYGVYIKVQTLLNMPPQGIALAMVTMYSYFYGKKSIEKIKQTTKWSLIFLLVWGSFCALLLNIFPSQIVLLFKGSDELRSIAISAMKIIGLTYFVSTPFHMYTSFFQATERSYLSLIFIVARQFLGRIPMAMWLSKFGKVNLVWWCYPISEVISDVVVIVVFCFAMRNTFNKIRLPEIKHE